MMYRDDEDIDEDREIEDKIDGFIDGTNEI
jgi:hypothetical protein